MSWDDGQHLKVKKVQLTFDDVIRSIQVEYEGTTLQSQLRGSVGSKSDGFTLGPDEYITELNGYYKTTFSGDVITALTFKTNNNTYGPYGNKTRNYFSAEAPKDKQIAGFLGTSGNSLNSIDVHFAPIPPPGSIGGNTGGTGGTTGGTGGTTGNTGGTGGTTGGTGGTTGGTGGTTGGTGGTSSGTGGTTGGTGGNTGETGGTSGGTGGTAGGTGGTTGGTGGTGGTTGGTGGNTGGTGGHTGGTGGNTDGTEGTSGGTGGSTGGTGGTTGGTGGTTGDTGGTTGGTGGTGGTSGGTGGTTGGTGGNTGGTGGTSGGTGGTTGGTGGNTGGTGGTTGSTGGTSGGTDSSVQKVEAQGGKGGNQWDDGADHDGVTKIHIAAGGLGIENIKFEYVKNAQPKEGALHGVKARAFPSTFEINHPTEYLISVKGWYDSSNIIQGIQFKTNTKSSDIFGYEFAGDGTEFTLEVKDKKIVGFHGTSSSHLNSLGAYFAPIASTPLTKAKKLQAKGGDGGASWDDGVFDGVTKVFVGQGNDGVAFVMFEYKKGSQVILGEGRGKKTLLGTETFELDYPSEYITAVEGYYDKIFGVEAEVVTCLIFKTNKRTSDPFGLTSSEHFEFKVDGQKIVGFHGKASDYVHKIGVYVAPITN